MGNPIKFLKTYQADIVLTLAVVFISITAFNLGKISVFKQQKNPLTISGPGTINSLASPDRKGSITPSATPNPAFVSVIASKNSTGKVYHFPWCASGSKISEKNKITFATEAAAISAGYTLAGNCLK